MPDDSNGIYSVPAGTIVSTGDTILPSQHNPWANDSASAISNRFSKDGRAPATGNWNLNGFRITGLGDAVASGDAVSSSYAESNFVSVNSQLLTDPKKAQARSNIGVLSGIQNAIVTTSGTTVDFTGITPNLRRITINFGGVSTNGTSALVVQIGDAGGFETSGYDETVAIINSTSVSTSTSGGAGFVVAGLTSIFDAVSGSVTLTKIAEFRWSISGSTRSNSTVVTVCGGDKSLTTQLDRVRIRAFNGTDTFDAGVINIIYD